MWNRKELKEIGKFRFTKNYWKALLAGLVLTLALGGAPSIHKIFEHNAPIVRHHSSSNYDYDYEDYNGIFSDFIIDFDEIKNELRNSQNIEELIGTKIHQVIDHLDYSLLRTLFALAAVISIIAASATLCIRIFLLNPLMLGGKRYFLLNLHQDADLKELGFGFTNHYLNTVKTLFLRDLFTFLWSLLFVIPGLIKKYEYLMMPYLLANNPDMDTNEAFRISRQMMMGNKWNAFVLDLSFIGWYLLNAITAGIFGIFFTNPYKYQTDAALFEALSQPNPGNSSSSDYESYVEID